MPKIMWEASEGYAGYDPNRDEIIMPKRYKEKVPIILGHEISHFRLRTTEESYPWDKFWQELAVWEDTVERLPREELRIGFIGQALGSYLKTVKWNWGEDSAEYQEAYEAYKDFLERLRRRKLEVD